MPSIPPHGLEYNVRMKNSKIRATALFGLLLFLSVPLAAQQITLLHTSDIHGHIYPFDYFRNQTADIGLARIATLTERIRQEGQPVVLLDAGDTIQGSAMAYYHHRRNPGPRDPMMTVMSELGFDAMTVGNHEFNFGMDVIEKSSAEASFPWLSANIVKQEDESPYFTPYLIKELDGIRLGILGLTTPNVPNWETPENYAGLEFLDTVDAARRYVPLLREEEKVDAVIVLTHQALERDLATGTSNQTEYENQVYRLITQVPGIDVVLMGHAHQELPPQEVEGVVICEPGPWGRALCRVDLFFEKDASGSVQLARWSGDLISSEDVEPDREVLELAKVYHEQTLGYIGSVIGEAVEPISADRARFHDTPIMDLLQRVMLEKSGAQLSLAALLPYSFDGIPAGPVTVQQIFSFYIYDNTLAVVELTGKEIKEVLEHSARYYQRASYEPETGRLILDIDPEVRHYNFDILAGAQYRIDPSRPVGQRIRDLTYQDKPMAVEDRFTLVTTNYRTAGGGGFPALEEAKVVWRSSEEVRNLLIDYIREQGRIHPVCDYNWVVAPDVSPAHR